MSFGLSFSLGMPRGCRLKAGNVRKGRCQKIRCWWKVGVDDQIKLNQLFQLILEAPKVALTVLANQSLNV